MGHKWDKCQFLPTIIRYLWWGCSSLPWSILRWVKPKLKYQSAWYTTQKRISFAPLHVQSPITQVLRSPDSPDQPDPFSSVTLPISYDYNVAMACPCFIMFPACLVPNECRTWGESPAMLKITSLLGVAACYRIPVKIQDILNKTSQIIWMWLTLSWFLAFDIMWVKQ